MLYAFSGELQLQVANLEYMVFCRKLWKLMRQDLGHRPYSGRNVCPTYGPVYLLKVLHSEARS